MPAHERARWCAQWLADGLTLQQIGDRFGISRERVRQIINNETPYTAPQIIAARKERERAERLARHLAEKEAVGAWSEANPGVPYQRCADELHLDVERVVELLGRRRPLHDGSHSELTSKWTDAEIVDLVARYHADTGDDTADGFEEWARGKDAPSAQLVALRFGKWRTALRAAGVEVKEKPHRTQYSDEDLWAALVEFYTTREIAFTYRDYELWAKDNPGRPSGALLRRRLDRTWTGMRTVVLGVLAGDTSFGSPEWVADITAPRDWGARPEPEFTVEEAKAFLARAHDDLGGHLSWQRYDQWAAEHDAPTIYMLTAATGKGYVDLARAVGVTPPRRGRWTDEQVADAMRAFRADHPTGRDSTYRDWAADRDVPGLQTMLRRLGDNAFN